MKTFSKKHNIGNGQLIAHKSYDAYYKQLSKYDVGVQEIRNFQVKYYEGEFYREAKQRASDRGHTMDTAARFYAV